MWLLTHAQWFFNFHENNSKMRYAYFLFLILIGFIPQLQAQGEKATVYLVRGAGPDNFVPYFTYVDDTLMCKLGNGKFSVHELEPGERKIHAQYKGKVKSNAETDLFIKLEAGKTYYISVNIETKAFGKGYFYCEQLTEEVGKQTISVFAEDKKCL